MTRHPVRPRTASARSGILLYLALGLMIVLAIMANILFFLGQVEDLTSIMVYRSEALTAMGEAVLEESFIQITEQLNIKKPENQIYFDVRETSAKDIHIDSGYLARITPNSRAMIAAEFPGTDKERDVVLKGKIADIQPFDIRGFTDASVRDPVEKHGTLELEVSVRWATKEQEKTIAVARPFKVVKVVMPVFSETTLFVNNAQPDYFGYWPSLYGYSPGKFPEPQPSLVLDNGWHGYAKENKKTDFIRHFEDSVLERAKVPPGRIFINKGVVPLTNGDRASGMLQKAFHSAESEFLPKELQAPLKAIKEQLARHGFQASPDLPDTSPVTPTAGGGQALVTVNGTVTTRTDARAAYADGGAAAAAAVPGKGELFVRYVGHGEELKEDSVKVGDKKMDGYGTYFRSTSRGPWASADRRLDPALSGLDLFGRVVEREKGQAFAGEGVFGKLFAVVRNVGEALLEKLYAKYRIRISPTLVYGDVIHTYFRVIDYVETGWWDKMRNMFSFNPNQFPLPDFPDRFLDGKDENTPISRKADLPADWDDKFKERWLKLPADVRKPKFHKILARQMFPQFGYGLSNEFASRIPPGAIFAHYNEALLNFLTPDPQSKIRGFFNQMGERNTYFLKNETDRQYQSRQGPFWKNFSEGLDKFNPFLFYVKATDYISSVYDPRDMRKSLFYERYYDRKNRCFDFKGVIYITGTEDLVLGNAEYRGKAIIITFGRVVFNGFFVKKKENDKPHDTEANANLTIVTLGGAVFDTSERVEAQVYSFIYPPMATPGKKIQLYGALGANVLDLDKLRDGGEVVFDYTYHIPPDMAAKDRAPYYHVAITNEIKRYGYSIRRDRLAFDLGQEGVQR
jgi:hypothetical protein